MITSRPDVESISQSCFEAIIKPTNQCNMACKYCYANHECCGQSMDDLILETVISSVSKNITKGQKINFIWHGGEPLTLGLDFYRKITNFQRKYCRGLKVSNIIQTNGTLLDNNSVRFFIDNGFSISISLDGPKYIHDANRKFQNGKGTFNQVMKSISLLHKYGIDVGAVTVLTKEALPNIKEIYNFMKSVGVRFRINPIVYLNRKGHSDSMFTPLEYATAMCELFDLWFFDDEPLYVDPINQITGNMISCVTCGCCFGGGCIKNVVCIDMDGNIYPCGQFAGHSEFCIGNILTDTLKDILNKPLSVEIMSRSSGLINRCRSCEFVNICNSGCTASALMNEKGILAPDYYCAGRKILFSHIRERIDDEIKRVKCL